MKNLLSFASVLALVAVASCGKPQSPAKPAAPAAPAAEAAKPGAAPAAAPAAEAGKPGAPAAAPAAEAPKPADPKPAEPAAEAGAGLDKDKLSNCYTEVYCAQKKNEMSKLLDIYKKYGFETPQDFNKTWMEAAKDKEWITKLAHEVSKKCQ